MDTFFKDEMQSFQDKFNRLLKKFNALRRFKWVNSGVRVKDPQAESGDVTILILLVVCAFLFWL